MLRRANPETAIGSETEVEYLLWRIEAKMVIQVEDQREVLHWRSFVKRRLCYPWRRWNMEGEDNMGPISCP
jgi:hypothetical protein